MKSTLMTGALLAALASFGAQADDASSNPANNGGWTGSGEFGFASSDGNSRSENINAKLGVSQENELWKNNFFLNGLRSKGESRSAGCQQGNTIDASPPRRIVTTGGASVGYKLDPRSYIVTAARYEHDDFGANLWQGIVSVGYGYIALKNERAELSFEVGPGYKRYRRPSRCRLSAVRHARWRPPETVPRSPEHHRRSRRPRSDQLQVPPYRQHRVRRHAAGRSGLEQPVLPERYRPVGQHDQEGGAEARLPDALQQRRAAGHAEHRLS